MKLKIGDTVKMMIGRDRGQTGKIEKVFPKEAKVVVPNLALYKKHVKKTFTADGKGGIFDIPRPIDVSKLALICPHCEKETRVGFVFDKDGKKERVCKKCKKMIDQKVTKKAKETKEKNK